MPLAEAKRIEADALNFLRGCFYVDDVNAFYELRPEAELQKALAQKSQEALFDNFAGTHVDMLLAQYDEEDEYKIVGSQEADPFESKISNESPIAQALFDHKVGDVVTVESPNGKYDVKIEAESEKDCASKLFGNVEVESQDRSGYAHFGYTDGIGAYNDDGTVKSNAKILYVTNENKNTITMTINGTEYVGLVDIMQKLFQCENPVLIRVIGTIYTNQWNYKNVEPRLTDGSNNSGEISPEAAAEIAKEYGVRIYTKDASFHSSRYLGRSVTAYYKEREAKTAAESADEAKLRVCLSENFAPGKTDTPLRTAERDVKCRILLEHTVGGYRICYRRVGKTNELVVNGMVYDDMTATIENKHELTATVDGHDIRVGYDGDTHSYLTLDGVTAARKLRWF